MPIPTEKVEFPQTIDRRRLMQALADLGVPTAVVSAVRFDTDNAELEVMAWDDRKHRYGYLTDADGNRPGDPGYVLDTAGFVIDKVVIPLVSE